MTASETFEKIDTKMCVGHYLNFAKNSTENIIKLIEMLVDADKLPEPGYGSIFVCGDYEGDLEAIAKLLNDWKWDSDGKVEFKTDGHILTPTVERACDPTVLPHRLRVLGGVTEEQCKNHMEELWGYEDFDMVNGEYDEEAGEEIDGPCIDAIKRAEISKLLKRGSITLFAFDKDSSDLYFQRLAFHADGSAEWNKQSFSVDREGVEYMQERAGKLPPL